MGFFNKKINLDLDGYIIDTERGLLIKAPINLSVYNIPSVVKEISISALNNMKQSAVEINFSHNTNINSLPFGAFSGFNKLAKVILPPNLKKMDYFFDGNALNNGVEIVLPKGLEQFALNQFSPNTVRLELEDSVTAIKGGIVSHNNVLEELIINGNVRNLAKYSVNQVKFLEKIWLKEGIIAMDDEAIRGCNNLREVHIPESLKIFKLGNDDFRPVNGFAFNGKKYIPTQEEIKKEQNRIIKLYKIINGNEVVFEVRRNQFKSMTDTGRELVFQGQDNSQYRIPKEEIVNYRYISVDIMARKMLAQIEKLLGFPISNTRRIKDKTTGDFKTILKTQRELSDDLAFLLEELEEDYVMDQLDNKTIIEYTRYIKTIYREFISNAPFEIIDVNDIKTSSQEKNFYQEPQQYLQPKPVDEIDEYAEQLRRKYGYYEGSTFEQAMIDKFIYSEIHKDEEEIDKVDEIRGEHRK